MKYKKRHVNHFWLFLKKSQCLCFNVKKHIPLFYVNPNLANIR